MSIAITGASGFIGSNLRQRLGKEHTPFLTIPHSAGLEEIVHLLKEGNAEGVIHLASVFIAEHKPEDIDVLIQSNIGFGTRVLEACRLADVKRLVMTGSSWQHSANSAVNLYGALKTGLEEVARFYSDAYRFSVAFLKLYDSFGPGDNRPKLVPHLLKAFLEGPNHAPLLFSAGEQLVDFTHVENSIEALLKAYEWTCKNPGSFQDFRVSGRELMSLRSFITTIEEEAKFQFNIQWGARPYREREVMIPWQEAPEIPDFEPIIPLRQGLAKMFSKPS